jgi:hypothetical protein
MMMIRFFLLTAVMIFMMAFTFQDEPDYQPRSLGKAVNSFGGGTGVQQQLRRVVAADTLSGMKGVSGRYFHLDDSLNRVKYVYVGRVNSCRAEGCSAPGSALQGNAISEYFDYYILFDSSLSVLRVEVYNYAATHGQQITARRWLRQFIGYNGTAELVPGKNVDAISGATISVQGITADIMDKQALLRLLADVS